MKKKIIIIGLLAILIISLIIYLYIINKDVEEYIPQQEVSKEDERKATVTLFFQNKETKNLEAESRNIDSNDLLLKPYESIINLLIEGPESKSLEKLIPDGTILNSVVLENYCLKIDFSRQFIENCSEDENIRKNIIDSIFNTVTQLNEVFSIKILMDGVDNLWFPNSEIKF